MKRFLKARGAYDLRSVVFSHGWSDLPPFRVVDQSGEIQFPIRAERSGVNVTVRPRTGGVEIETDVSRIPIHAIDDVRWMLQLDTDLTDFYKHANTQERSWIVERKMGRLLRSQTVFEDLIKLILTTNCSWALTRKMTEAMARHLGTRVRNDLTLFPNAEALASKNEAFYRKKIRCGYRSAYLPTIARMVLGGKVRPERWRSNEISTEEIRKEILSIPGAGPYVAENLLRLLGKHDHLGLDRWARGKLKNLWNARRQPSDRQIRRRYHLHGRFRGLVLWCDLTQEWFQGGVFSDWIRMSPLKSQ